MILQCFNLRVLWNFTGFYNKLLFFEHQILFLLILLFLSFCDFKISQR